MDGVFQSNILAMRDLASIFPCTWTVKGRNMGISALRTQTSHQIESKSGLGCRWRMRLFWASHQAKLSDPTFIKIKLTFCLSAELLSVPWLVRKNCCFSWVLLKNAVTFLGLEVWTQGLDSSVLRSGVPGPQTAWASCMVRKLSQILCRGYLNSSHCPTEEY